MYFFEGFLGLIGVFIGLEQIEGVLIIFFGSNFSGSELLNLFYVF